ncbi:MAG: glycosyltransferase [Bacteroidales bacterium]|jgi:cellulose synthase/poly-beta-1,6-N-acetylglucosamine synthase-like glycosyltransferase
MILKIFFWIPVLLILHTYVVYPLLLILLDRFIKPRKKQNNSTPQFAVSVLMAVHNEEQVLTQKIRALFDSDYPADLLEVLVGSDASDDKTVEILEDLKNIFPKLKVFCYTQRRGKPAIINDLSEKAAGDLLIITDANVIPDHLTIKRLVRNFEDKSVGLTDSRPLNKGLRKDGISLPETAYLSFESKLKYIEGRIWGTMMGPFGGFYAVRKGSYLPNKGDTLADDFRICMNVIRKGEKAISDPEAIVYEDVPNNLLDEFNRKVRISAGNFQNLKHFSKLLLRPFTRWSFIFISHKVLRWLTPIFWFVLIVSNILLAKSSIFYLLFFVLQVIFIILPPLDMLLKRAGLNLVPLMFLTHLFFMNAALFTGFLRYIGGIKSGVWTPTKRFQ